MNAELLEIINAALTHPRRGDRAELKQLAAAIRKLSAGRRQTASEDLLRESRDQRGVVFEIAEVEQVVLPSREQRNARPG